MKKVSTAGVKQIRNFSEQKLTIGLDLGDRASCGSGSGNRGPQACSGQSRFFGDHDYEPQHDRHFA